MEIKIPGIYRVLREREKQCACVRKGRGRGERENKVGGLELAGFKIQYKNTLLKVVWNWYKIRNMVESKEISSCEYSQSSIC